MRAIHDLNLKDSGGICQCGALNSVSLIFGGRREAHMQCSRCKREYNLDGELLARQDT